MSTTEMFANALGYEDLMGRWSARLAPLFAEFAGVRDGGRVLDVGCGTGSLTRALVALAPRAHIVGIDPAAPFIEYVRTQTRDPRVAFEVGDAMALPFPPESFDAALSCLVLHFVPEPEKAAGEMRRVTRAGGVVAACTWDRSGMELASTFWDEAARLDPAAAGKQHERLSQPGQLAALWHTAGLGDVEERALDISMDFASLDDYWRPLLRGVGPIGAYVATLTPERRDALRSALGRRFRERGAPGPFVLRAKALAVRGVA